jgi:transcriptional regulator
MICVLFLGNADFMMFEIRADHKHIMIWVLISAPTWMFSILLLTTNILRLLMYNVPYFKVGDQQQVLHFMKDNPFVVLTGCTKELKVVATHIPLLIKERDDKLYLRGHVMRNTDHHKAFEYNPQVMAIFTGPHAYVSASSYTDQQQASTWNYMTVHASGQLTFGDDDLLMNVLAETTSHFENDPSSPSLMEHLPTEYVQKLSKAIVAFEIEVLAIEHVFKLSQNRDEESYRNIIHQLEKGNCGAKEVAGLMKANRKINDVT